MSRRTLLIATAVYALFWVIVFASWFGIPFAETFASDASGYSKAAIHLLQSGFYSIDGVQPYFLREPGMSLFLVPVFAAFGPENAYALFFIQGILYWLACLLFAHQLLPIAGKRVTEICFVLLLTHISVFHTIFSAYRECFTLVVLLCFASVMLAYMRRPTTWKALAAGVLLGFATLTYYSFLFFPLFLAVVLWLQKVRLRDALLMLIVPAVVVSPWILRNASYGPEASIQAQQRLTYALFVRAEQAEKVHGFEPFMCLWAEYISRDWTGRSDACSFNGVKNRKWPGGVALGNEEEIAEQSKARIFANFGSYLWFSVVDIIEQHLPFVGGGWSTAYNGFAALASLVLYVGFIAGARFAVDRRYLLFSALIAYNTLFFVLTDATPRYLLPILFCYTIFAALGYERVLRWRSRS